MNFEAVSLFFLYLVLGVAMLAIFTRLYVWITPYDEAADIAKGRLAPAISLAGAMLGVTFPLLIASYSRSSVMAFMAWGALACFAQLVVFWVLYYWLLPRSIDTNNTASATCFAAASICVGLINAASALP